MQKWEYWSIQSRDGETDTTDGMVPEQIYLDKLGAEGWELISVVPDASDIKFFYFKRPTK